MSEPVPYTTEDRDMLRSVRDALLGTFERRGLITNLSIVEGKIDSHLAETHAEAARVGDRAVMVARGVATEAVEVAAILATRTNSPRRFLYNIAQYAAGSTLALIVTWVLATFALGFKVGIVK